MNDAQEKMKQKQALSALHRLYWAYFSAISNSQYEKKIALFNEAHEAISTLAHSILGPPIFPLQQPFLCEFCHSAYHEYYVQEKAGRFSRGCCAPCKKALLTEGKLLIVDGVLIGEQQEGEK